MTIAAGQAATAADQLKIHQADGELQFTTSTELTISGDAITPLQNFHRIDTQSDASTDDLSTINLGVNMAGGYFLILRAEHTDRTVIIKHGVGNILCVGNQDVTLNDSHDFAILVYDTQLAGWMCRG